MVSNPRTLQQAILFFSDYSNCHRAVMEIRWPDGVVSCPHCGFTGHRDLTAAAIIATRTSGGPTATSTAVVPGAVTHRRAGRHLPGAGRSRRDPRRHTSSGRGSVGPPWPAPTSGESLAPQRGSMTTADLPANANRHGSRVLA